MPKIDFGLQIEPQFGFDYNMITSIANKCESLGLKSIWLSDHFFMTKESINIPCLECWTTLAALAKDTKKLRIGAMVSAQSYRNPALLANIAATLDNISNGRLNFGIGAGWKKVEYLAYGYTYYKPVIRIKQLSEAVQIIKKMWTEDKPIFKGRYYSIKEALCFPHPIQKPHIPVWIGGLGNLTLKVVAKYANACNFAWTITPKIFKQKLMILNQHCLDSGRDYNLIRKSAGLMLNIAQNETMLRQKQKEQAKMNPTIVKYSSKYSTLVGTPDTVSSQIRKYISLGVDYFILRFHFGDEIESLTLFMDEVKKQL